MRRIIKSISIHPKIWKKAKKIAEKQNRTVSNLIEELIRKEK